MSKTKKTDEDKKAKNAAYQRARRAKIKEAKEQKVREAGNQKIIEAKPWPDDYCNGRDCSSTRRTHSIDCYQYGKAKSKDEIGHLIPEDDADAKQEISSSE